MDRSMRWLTVLALLVATGCGSCADNNVETGAQSGAGQASSAAQSQQTQPGPQPLFVIKRSTNANVLHYDAQVTAEGKLDSNEPVVAYWTMLEEEGQREELNWVEREKAYGFTVEPSEESDAYVMSLIPLPEREITVRQTDGSVRAEMTIDGERAVLKEVYIESSAGLLGPKVEYIQLLGKDLTTGEERTEKIVPE